MATALPPSSALTVRLTGPADGSTLYTPAPVSGTVGGAGVRSWTLEHRLDSDRTWTALASGAGPTTGSALATFDPTRLLNGLYELRLSATDRQGRVVTDSAYVVVGGDFKLGVYRHQVVDLELPLVGPALRLARTYDSRDRRQGDFGLGWSLDLTDVRAEATGLFGLGWEVVGATGSTAGWCLQPARSHRVSVTFADGRLAQFQPAVDTPCGASPPEIVTVSFRPLDGTTAA
ncbi:MAG: DUF6531 domain-containing protein, partial [Chloroflexota bacterium]|nr:DUF6531 domain-containing protein [Chloroflexota bacterium]